MAQCTYDPTSDIGGIVVAGAPHPDYSLMAIPEMSPDEKVESAIIHLLDLVKQNKPGDSSDKDRLWTILRTDTEKLLAFWFYLEMQ